MNQSDPLQKLIVSESQAVDRQALADLLSPYLSINKETQSFDFSGTFLELTNADRILIVLCAVKARSLVLGSDEKITPLEIIKLEIAPEGSIKNTLKKLLESKDIKSDKGQYYLPNYKLLRVIARFKKNNQQ
ncbi:MAG: hypothetical protein CEN90_540 [Parcubacteria group bacterium Licking1014_17]|nr:MAG: hypothetical protein CEN90_540 [Parcubacteria group bacterium Licking1014_17]